MHYRARQLELLDRTYFAWPDGWHSVESADGRYLAHVLAKDGAIKDLIVAPVT
jgi:hypothetical protein